MMKSLIVASIVSERLLLILRYRTFLTYGILIVTLGFYLMSTMDLATNEFPKIALAQ
ncbi:hypothetical protein WAK64_12975 [Bacillus spongiae]|uniref:ABC transporter permease n=1 Tax=Bacillus spongiae TaxID=2683610 RepID=A0ABU8HF05_9BACI